jgi:ubiquinone/menaquinone biosynthesis C-methylase UbiE
MSWKYSDEYYKNYTRETWDECAEKYIPLMKQLAPYHKALLDLIQPRPGERVLDVCTGPGEPAMSMASMVEPTGQVTGVDLSPKMNEMATKTSEKRRLSNVRFLIMDAEKLNLPSDSFDLAVSCFGLQIVTQPETAAKEIFRVVKPGGRVAFTVWSKGDHATALDVLIGPMLEYAEPDETGYLPTPYELGGEGELTAMLETIGFVHSKEARVTNNWVANSVEDYLNMVLDGSPLGHSLSEETQETQRNVIEKAKRNIAQYAVHGKGVSIPAECIIAYTSKPIVSKK